MDDYSLHRAVTEADTAAALDASLPPAASTPFVLALAEGACHGALGEHIRDGELSVGARAEIDHLAPSPVGAELTATAHLIASHDRRYDFEVEVREGDQLVARVKHTRAVVPRVAIIAALHRAD